MLLNCSRFLIIQILDLGENKKQQIAETNCFLLASVSPKASKCILVGLLTRLGF